MHSYLNGSFQRDSLGKDYTESGTWNTQNAHGA